MEQQKQGPSELYRDLFDPGWREREAARQAEFERLLGAIPARRNEPPNAKLTG